jgi:hypothetical protein
MLTMCSWKYKDFLENHKFFWPLFNGFCSLVSCVLNQMPKP